MSVAEPERPDCFADSFPRGDFPRDVWTERPAGLPARVWTTETTHRDGQQGGLPLIAEQGLTVSNLLCPASTHRAPEAPATPETGWVHR